MRHLVLLLRLTRCRVASVDCSGEGLHVSKGPVDSPNASSCVAWPGHTHVHRCSVTGHTTLWRPWGSIQTLCLCGRGMASGGPHDPQGDMYVYVRMRAYAYTVSTHYAQCPQTMHSVHRLYVYAYTSRIHVYAVHIHIYPSTTTKAHTTPAPTMKVRAMPTATPQRGGRPGQPTEGDLTHQETRGGMWWTTQTWRGLGSKNRKTTPRTVSTTPRAPTSPTNAATTPQGTLATAAVRKHSPDTAREGKNG